MENIHTLSPVIRIETPEEGRYATHSDTQSGFIVAGNGVDGCSEKKVILRNFIIYHQRQIVYV
jgi:hypothetical protein